MYGSISCNFFLWYGKNWTNDSKVISKFIQIYSQGLPFKVCRLDNIFWICPFLVSISSSWLSPMHLTVDTILVPSMGMKHSSHLILCNGFVTVFGKSIESKHSCSIIFQHKSKLRNEYCSWVILEVNLLHIFCIKSSEILCWKYPRHGWDFLRNRSDNIFSKSVQTFMMMRYLIWW